MTEIPVTRELMMAWAFRVIIGFAVLAGLPMAGYLMQRMLNKADEISNTVHGHDTKLEIIGDRITGVRETLQDHENRIRSLERGPR